MNPIEQTPVPGPVARDTAEKAPEAPLTAFQVATRLTTVGYVEVQARSARGAVRKANALLTMDDAPERLVNKTRATEVETDRAAVRAVSDED